VNYKGDASPTRRSPSVAIAIAEFPVYVLEAQPFLVATDEFGMVWLKLNRRRGEADVLRIGSRGLE
jgi:hypothetical protein